MACEEVKEDHIDEDHLNQSCTIEVPMHTGETSEQNFSSGPIDSDTHCTNEHSTLLAEPTLLTKRKSRGETDSTSGSSYKRQRVSQEQPSTGEQTIIEISDSDDSLEVSPCAFPEFEEALRSEKKRDLKQASKISKNSGHLWTPSIPASAPLYTETLQFTSMTPQIPDSYLEKKIRANNVEKKENAMEVFEKAALLAKRFKGECLSQSYSICKGKTSLKFKCPNNHTFFISVDYIESIETRISSINNQPKIVCETLDNDCCWCYKCKSFYNHCENAAA